MSRIKTKYFITLFILSAIIIQIVNVSATTIILRPNAAGTFQSWQTYGSPASHTVGVNDNLLTTGVNITANIVLNETFNFDNLPANAYSIDNVTGIMTCNVTRGTSTAESIVMKRYNGTWVDATAQALQRGVLINISNVFLTQFNKVSTVNAMELGMRGGALGATEMARCAEYYAIVNYVEDTTPPNWSNAVISPSTVRQNMNVQFNTSWSDTQFGVAGYIFSINQTGTWVNTSYVSLVGASIIATNITNVTAVAGTTVQWMFYVNDSVGNMNNTMTVQSFSVSSATTCTCPAKGSNWVVATSDNCIITSDCDIRPGNLSFTGTANTFNCSASINITQMILPTNLKFYVTPTCRIIT